MAGNKSAPVPSGRFAVIVAGAAVAVLAIGVTWYCIGGNPPEAVESVTDTSHPVPPHELAEDQGGGPVDALAENTTRVAASSSKDPSPPADFEWLAAIEGNLVQSRLGPAFDLSSIKALTAVVSIGSERQRLVIPVYDDRFHLEYVEQSDGSFALHDGSHVLPSSAIEDVETATIELVAPTLTNSVGALRFTDLDDPTAQPKQRIEIPFGQRALILTLQAPPIVRLWVTDAASGGSIEGASVYTYSSTTNGRLHFDNSPRATRGGSGNSPIAKQLKYGAVIPCPGDATELMEVGLEVRVPGFSPGHATANFRDGGDLHVALQASGSVLALVVGGPLSGGEIVIRNAGGAQAERSWREARPLNELREIRFDSIPPGGVLVSLEGALKGPNAGSIGGILDLQEVLVTGGSTTEVRLHAVDHSLNRAQAAGRILLPTAWTGVTSIALKLTPQQGQTVKPVECVAWPSTDELQRTTETPSGYRAFAFDAGELPLGRYQLELEAPLWQSQVIVPPGGTTALEVRVPEPTTYSFRLVDHATGQPTSHAEVSVGFPPPLPGKPEYSRLITRPASSDTFTFQATTQFIVLTVPETADYAELFQNISPKDGTIGLRAR